MGGAFFPVQTGDTVRLRKAHPCGGRDWKITRTGADIGLECRNCGRRIVLPRDEFDRRCAAHMPSLSPSDVPLLEGETASSPQPPLPAPFTAIQK